MSRASLRLHHLLFFILILLFHLPAIQHIPYVWFDQSFVGTNGLLGARTSLFSSALGEPIEAKHQYYFFSGASRVRVVEGVLNAWEWVVCFEENEQRTDRVSLLEPSFLCVYDCF